jgi:predicted glycosyltransferase
VSGELRDVPCIVPYFADSLIARDPSYARRMADRSGDVLVWIDIENAPQVQYLFPFVQAFRRKGASVILTARNYGSALELLEARNASFHVVGAEFGKSKVAKVLGALTRARALASIVRQNGEPAVSLSASRASALAARWIGIPSYVIVDYEHASLGVYRFANSTIMYPDVIDSAALRRCGLRESQLVPFHGLKEDISLRDARLDAAADPFSEIADDTLVRILFRPPTETSHYFQPESRELALCALEYFASVPEAKVVYVPRHPWQYADISRFVWRNEPVVVEQPIAVPSLFRSVDLVVCSGGTMLREAAYLGVPAYSILKSRIGAVDRFLASIGRVKFIGHSNDLAEIEVRKARPTSRLATNPQLLDELVEIVLTAVENAKPWPLERQGNSRV